MQIKIPTRMEPYLVEFVADTKARMIAALGQNPPQEQVDEINNLPPQRILLDVLKNSLIQWRANKTAQQMREQMRADQEAMAGDLE